MLRIAAGGKRIRCAVMDDINTRHGQAGGDGHLFHNIEQFRIIFVRDGCGAADGQHHAVAGVVGQPGQEQRDAGGDSADQQGPADVQVRNGIR